MSMTISDRAARLLALDPTPSPPAFGEAAAMAPAAVEAVHDALSRGETHYTDRPGILPLREKVADLLNRRFGLSFDAGRITLTCGVTEARFVTVQQLLLSGGLVAAPLHADRIAGAVIVRDGRLTHDLEEADLLFAAAGATPTVIREWLAHVPSRCIVVYEVDTRADRFHPAQAAGFENRVVTIGSLDDEDGLAGARLGYLAASAGQAAGLRDFKQALTICSTNLSQWAALAVVEDL
jgi:aspartate/methionine/tyrosine aminotransferase